MRKHGSAGSRCKCQYYGGQPDGRKRCRNSPAKPKTAFKWLPYADVDDAVGADRARNAASVRTFVQSNPFSISSSFLQKSFASPFKDP